jgi:signal transduction histidine kinase
MKSRLRAPSRRYNSLIIILVIAVIGGSLAVASYQYSNSVSNGIQTESIASANTGAQIEVSEMSHILVNQMLTVGKNLQVLSASEPVQTDNITSATPLFVAAQNTTSELASTYSWIAANGDLMIARNSTGEVPPTIGVNLTSRPFFVAVQKTGTPYYGDVILSLQLVPEVVVAWPIFSQTGVDGQTVRTFEGIVAATIDVITLGNFLKSQLPPALNSGIGAIDPSGDLLYTNNQTLLGLSVFGPQFQAILPPSFQSSFDDFLHLSLAGGSGIYDLFYGGTRASIAYQPVLINATTSETKPIFFAVLYVTTVDVLAANQAAQVNLLRLFFAASIVVIGVSGLVAAAVVLNWNSRLDRIIKRRTADLVAANTELAEQSQAQKDLINIAAHELRTPTQSILASSELLKDALNPSSTPPQQYLSAAGASGSEAVASPPPPAMSDGDVRDLVDSTFRNAQRLQKITNNLLVVARIDTKSVKMELETFDLNEKISSIIGDFSNVAEVDRKDGKDVRIEFEPKQSTVPVRADKIKTYEVFSNLLRNAIRHSNVGGKIAVTSEKSGAYALVEIRDEGTGIDKALLPRLFEKFATNSGTGLGLYISKSYVEAMGGTIWAKNNDGAGPSGATFSFTLPLAESLTAPPAVL